MSQYIYLWHKASKHGKSNNFRSDLVLRENTDNGHLDVFLLEMVLVAVCDDGEAKDRQEDEEHVAQLASLLPR